MKFPAWADGPHLTNSQRASGRLKYIISLAALEMTGSASVRSLARAIDTTHETIGQYIRQGSFSYNMARRVYDVMPVKLVDAQGLVEPLSIKTK